MSKRRVVVTGLGLLTPVGNNVADSWKNIQNGVSGIAPITHFDVTDFPVRFGGSIRDFSIEDYISKKDARKMDPFIHYGMAAGIQAMEDSGLEITDENGTIFFFRRHKKSKSDPDSSCRKPKGQILYCGVTPGLSLYFSTS